MVSVPIIAACLPLPNKVDSKRFYGRQAAIIGIYKITNPKGKIYIGQSIDCLRRKARYENLDCKKQLKIYRSIKKYGWDAHRFEIIHECLPHELNELEIYYIELYQCLNNKLGLNLKSGGNHPIFSEETKLNMRLNHRGTTGYKMKEKTKKLIGYKNKGKLKGRKRNPESIKKGADKKRKGSFFNCWNCSTKFWRQPSAIKKGDNKFCSCNCYHIWDKGRKNPNKGQYVRKNTIN